MTTTAWLDNLRSSIPELHATDWPHLYNLADDLRTLTATAPSATNHIARSAWLQQLRADLAADYATPPGDAGAMWQIIAQFLAGYHDLDLRDATGPSHGAMILRAGTTDAITHWRPRIEAGALIGIAATERHGGSRIQEITTAAQPSHAGTWRITGEKCWVSRLNEAAGFVVFFRDPHGDITAAVVNANAHGLTRQPLRPCGLDGWGWGILRLDEVPVRPHRDLIGPPGGGLEVFRRHFATFRPLVTATAIGAAAGVHHHVAAALAARRKIGILPRIRDNALISLGKTHATLTAGLLLAITATRLAITNNPGADIAARCCKAAGVDTAYQSVTELAPLIGATGYQRGHHIAKTRDDLAGLLYADGIHDSLYRSAGTHLLTRATTPPVHA